ncbi:mucin-5AC-like [Melanaphis sacchari]|uniref:mucin-5AC-like n=1 Tax=Melanaphis sacchari TaxID=742174 RepID=UPI000DC13C2B|nr:mucin-5AC-like [Melanaphis sacchari]
MQYSQRRWCTAAVQVLVLSALVLLTHGATIKFDQSQTGDYNLQIHLKNIELYAVFDDSGGNDDEYEDLPDYTDALESSTKPPQNASTTYAPTSSTVATAAVVSTSSPALALLDPYSQSNSDKIVQMVEALIASNGNTSDLPTEQPPSSANAGTTSLSPPASGQSPSAVATTSTAASAATTNSTANRKCGPGYFRDPMGRCRRIRKPHLPFLQMVHTPGVIKSFQPQLRTTEDVSVKN